MWSLLITYGVSMILHHADALNDPFGYDLQDVKLNRLCSELAHEVLIESFVARTECADVIDSNHETPTWLENNSPVENSEVLQALVTQKSKQKFFNFLKSISKIAIGLIALISWSCLIIFLTWGLQNDKKEDDEDTARWWEFYIPITSETTGYISLVVFILLGFWVNDAYGRHWRALQLWQTEIKPKVLQFAFEISLLCHEYSWHQRDRERLLSHVAAIPFVAMLHLRGSRDVDVLNDILSPRDLVALAEADDLPTHVLHVVHGYLNAVDANKLSESISMDSTFGTALFVIQLVLPELENALEECDAIRKFPISPAFTLHLQIFTVFWLALLPLKLVLFHGFISFLFIVPIGYSIINLLRVARELADPFGDDVNDLPLPEFCIEIMDEIRDIYSSTSRDTQHYIRPTYYTRAALSPKRDLPPEEKPKSHIHQKTITTSLRSLVASLPSVPVTAQIVAIVWNIIAVFVSWGFSYLWSESKRNDCREWCSPVDVDPSVLANVGFALFLLLAFRSSDAIARYSDGARILTELGMHLRAIALEAVQSFKDGSFHPYDKERIVAHIVQIPLSMRDQFLVDGPKKNLDGDCVLSADDRMLLESSKTPLRHLLQTVEAYFISTDSLDSVGEPDLLDSILQFPATLYSMPRIYTIRQLIAQAFNLKRFPVIGAYRRHQHVFIVIWLALLPFAMTEQTGFFTILWASLISYGVLGMEEIANKLVDPYGTDAVDLPVREVCEKASASILEAVHAAGWDCERDIQYSPLDAEPRLGTVITENGIYCQNPVASSQLHSTDEVAGQNFSFHSLRRARVKPTLYAHVLQSVPWWALVAVIAWTTFACIISYITRSKDLNGYWWKSFISVDPSVATYISIATFAVLGFYVNAAFERYWAAGQVWTGKLRCSCHALAAQLLSYYPKNEVHQDDHCRIIGHIAAIPLALKSELRRSRDLRDLKGLLSTSDVARIQYADSMTAHCINVLRSYYVRVMNRPETIESNKVHPGSLILTIWSDLHKVESAVKSALYLTAFDIAPGVLVLLRALLGLWFIILPFILAELTGWFTILWMFLISYGVLGMYSIAAELQDPFGEDLNDFDIDSFADGIVADVLDVYRQRPCGWVDMMQTTNNMPALWSSSDYETHILDSNGGVDSSKLNLCTLSRVSSESQSCISTLREGLWLARQPIPWWVLASVSAWSTLAVTVAYFVGKHFGENRSAVYSCSWFCSPIAVNANVKEYIGFALFLLLAFRLTDSHGRYVRALQVWQELMIGTTRLVAERYFACCNEGDWHKGDLERIAGHLTAFSICIMGVLRGQQYREKLEVVLDKSDVELILKAKDRPDYCIDVLRSYWLAGEDRKKNGAMRSCAELDLTCLAFSVQTLNYTASDCRIMSKTLMPFGYVQHLRIFLFIWILLLPWGLVESSGWLAILWTVIIAYGVIGIERWAEELSDPFGLDLTDVPLENLCDEIIQTVIYEFLSFRQGMLRFINADRKAFPKALEE